MATTWDEPEGANTPRGWLRRGETVIGNYLDYGPDHYRSPHSYCQPQRKCRECEPGNVLALRYPGGPGTPSESRWAETTGQAREWVEQQAERPVPAPF